MKTFRVFGTLSQNYYMDVQAADKLEAYDIANQRNTNDWFIIEHDNVIEIEDVIEYDQELGVPAQGQLL